MKAYTPVDPVEVLTEKAVAKAGEIAKLDGNENPYGCSPTRPGKGHIVRI